MRKKGKPAILKHKDILARLIRQNWEKLEYEKHFKGYWWKGRFKKGDHILYIYYQLYVRTHKIDYIKIKFFNGAGVHLSPKDIKNLLREEFHK